MKIRGFLLATILCLFTHNAIAQHYGPVYNGKPVAKQDCFYFFPTTPDGDVVAGTNQYRLPVFTAFTVTDVYAYVSTAGATSAITVDVNESGSSILSPKITIDAGENNTTTAATPAVISDTALAANSLLTVDVDSADSGNTGAGLIVRLCGHHI